MRRPIPAKVNFSSGGIGVLPHLIGELFKARAGIDIVHVPYKGGGPSITDLLAGNVQMTFENSSVLLPLIQAGALRALAVTTREAHPAIAGRADHDRERFSEFRHRRLDRLVGARAHAAPIIAKLNTAINQGLKTPEFTGALAKLSVDPLGGTPADFTETMKTELARWSPIVKSLGLADQPASSDRSRRYSPWMPENLAIAVHFGTSLATYSGKSAGVPGLPLAPSSLELGLQIGEARPALIAALSFATTGCGVPGGRGEPGPRHRDKTRNAAFDHGRHVWRFGQTLRRCGRKRPQRIIGEMRQHDGGRFDGKIDLTADQIGQIARGALIGHDDDVRLRSGF